MHDNGVGTSDGGRRRKRPWISLAVVLCLVVGTGVALGLAAPKSKTPQRPHVPRPPLYAKAWDPRIKPLAAFVERNRGLKFAHPVFVTLLTSAQFNRQIGGADAVGPSYHRVVLQTQAMMRALGQFSDYVDLAKQESASSGSDVIGFYSYEDKHVWIRGNQLTPATKITIVHELTHALDDQHFDLGKTMAAFEAANSGGLLAFDAVAEGDARRIEGKYRATFSKAVLKRVDKANDALVNAGPAPTDSQDFPQILGTQSIAAYPLGLIAVSRVAARGGNRAVNALFRRPPTHEMVITQPWLLQTGWRPATVAAPMPGPHTKVIARGEFGSLDLYLLLSQAISFPQALAAADGWNGDQYVTYTSGGRPCIQIAVAGRDRGSARTIKSALARWVSNAGYSSTSMSGTTVTLSSCDPGAGFVQPWVNLDPALELLVVRNQIEADIEKDGFTRRTAVCFVQQLPGRFSTHLLETGKFSAQQQTVLQSIAQSCHAF